MDQDRQRFVRTLKKVAKPTPKTPLDERLLSLRRLSQEPQHQSTGVDISELDAATQNMQVILDQ